MAETAARFGSYSLADSDSFRRLGENRGKLRPQKIPPQVSIGRGVDRKDSKTTLALKDRWRDYLDEMGVKNYNKGKAITYGGIVLTYVNATEINRMIGKKYPELFDGEAVSRRHFQILKGLKGDYQSFIKDKSAAVATKQNEAVRDSSVPIDSERLRLQWISGTFDVSNKPEPFGKCDYSLVLSPEHEEILTEEMESSWNFMRQEGFDTNMIDRRRRPHISVVDAFNPIARVALCSVDAPERIALLPPKAFYNENKPF